MKIFVAGAASRRPAMALEGWRVKPAHKKEHGRGGTSNRACSRGYSTRNSVTMYTQQSSD